MDSKMVTVTDFIRNFGDYAALLPAVPELVLTRDGYPFATVKSTPAVKNAKLKSLLGLWKGTGLDDDKLWKRALKRNNRKNFSKW